jgi:tetratricopeptide (TPR) repeat protein
MTSAKNLFLCGVASVLAMGSGAGASLAQAPTHQHYRKPSAADDQPSPTGELAPRLQNLGVHKFVVMTKSERAQLFFNQGINLSYGFNHAEAGRAFRAVARLDPDCAMAYWGQALVLGPNINAPMAPDDEPKAYELVQRAIALKPKASERERAYIDALAQRYSGKPAERKARDRAYADAMRTLHERYADDLEAATLFAEALMDLRPWDYWTREGQPYPGTEEIVSLLESVMKRNPEHPGALHFYIHAMEATKNAEKAEAAADTLISLMPGAGHMVHMPAHIFMRMGRYGDASDGNELAIRADEDYIAQCRAQGIYPLGYYPHNIHFLWWAASMEGRSRVSQEAARKTASKIPPEQLRELPFLQGFIVVPYHAMVKFGLWDEILNEPKPAQESPFVQGVWHYARGMAFTARRQFAEAARELATLEEALRGESLRKMPASFSANTAQTILRIAPEVLAGEMAAKQGQFEQAIARLDRAVRLEDALIYTEPADWPFPTRHSLGAVLLQAGRPEEAAIVYWEDLRRYPENGWSLFGLMQALQAQGKNDEATLVEERFQKAWARADVKLTGSRF